MPNQNGQAANAVVQLAESMARVSQMCHDLRTMPFEQAVQMLPRIADEIDAMLGATAVVQPKKTKRKSKASIGRDSNRTGRKRPKGKSPKHRLDRATDGRAIIRQGDVPVIAKEAMDKGDHQTAKNWKLCLTTIQRLRRECQNGVSIGG